MPTIKDVAAKAHVAPSTVSNTLNGTRYVDPKTRERVWAAVEALGYRPNTLARGLRRRETRTIGLLLPDNANPFFAELARGIEDLGFAEGYSVVLCNSDRSPVKEMAYVDTLLSKWIDGLIISSGRSLPDVLPRILAARVPVVAISGVLRDLPVDRVRIDDYAGGYQAGAYLTSLGHRRVGCITGPQTTTASARRIDGFRRALADADVVLDERGTIGGDFWYASGEAGMTELLRRDLGLTAVFAANDLMALGAINALHGARVRVPEEVSVLGFDGSWLGTVVRPTLTTIAQPITELSRASVRLLLERIQGSTEPPRDLVLPTSIVERQSCCSPRAAAASRSGGVPARRSR